MFSDSRPRRFRRHHLISIVVAGTAILGAVLLARLGDSGPAAPAAAAPASAVPTLAPPTPRATAAGSSPGPARDAPVPLLTSSDAGAREVENALADAATSADVRYAFDAGPGRTVVDTRGRHALRPVVARGGAVAFARRGDGYAIRFPARCHAAPDRCPRAILESGGVDAFNPGTRPLRYGASVLMSRTDTAAGANVLQKGYSVGGGSQFKLQVDGRAGRPSCVLAGGRTIYRLVGPVGVADGRWHSVTCSRVGGRLSINIDGRAASRRVPAALSIRNNQPLRVGGKNAGPHNDQFAGRLDNVFVTLY